MSDLPSGTATFLFTDVEGSTRLLRALGEDYDTLIGDHRRLLRAAFEAHGGHEMGTEGDSFFVVFSRATDALRAATQAQLALSSNDWLNGNEIRVRMGMHTGEARLVGSDYVGLAVHQAARISAAAHGGQVLLSATSQDLIAEDLPPSASLRDLGPHRLKDFARPERLFQLCHPSLDAEFPPVRSMDVRRHNLPQQLTSFIGREREIDEVSKLLSSARLVTLTGSGGSGKTRLALRVTEDVCDDYADGACLVDLAVVSDPELLPQAVATALGLREQEGRPIDGLLDDYFALKSMLLVLDNCEHLVAACAQLVQRSLVASPDLKILVTTREPLGVPGEVAWRVPSLGVPDPKDLPPAEELVNYEAIRLFVDRASLGENTSAFGSDDLIAIAHICRRLDGIPLAIELAAARTEVLTPRQIADRLDDRFRLLTGGKRTALARQQTLRALVDWSYELLDSREQTLLNRVSVFAGGFTLEAAEAVGAAGEVAQMDVLELLSQLVRKSLINVDRRGSEARYRLLETIRQYGRERLLASPDAAEVRARHRDFYLTMAERAESELRGPDQKEWLQLLEAEDDNLRAALEWSLADESPEIAFRLILGLWRFWWIRGYWAEAGGWLEQALEVRIVIRRRDDRRVGVPAPDDLRVQVMWVAGFLAGFRGDAVKSRSLCEQTLVLADRLGDKRSRAYAMWILAFFHYPEAQAKAALEECLVIGRDVEDKQLTAWTLMLLTNYQDGAEAQERMCEASLELSREAGDSWNIAMSVQNLGRLAYRRGDKETALRLFDEALQTRLVIGDKWGTAASHESVAALALEDGDDAKADAHLQQARALYDQLGSAAGQAMVENFSAWYMHLAGRDVEALPLAEQSVEILRAAAPNEVQRTLSNVLHTLGEVLRALGDLERSLRAHHEALSIATARADRRLIAACLEGLGGIAAARGSHQRAAKLLAAAAALERSMSAREREIFDRDVAVARSGLEPDAFEAAWAEGIAATLDESVRYALGED